MQAVLVASTKAFNLFNFDWGRCPTDVPVKENFDLKRFLGNWYEIAETPSFFEPPTLEHNHCLETTFFQSGNSDIINVVNSDVNRWSTTTGAMFTPDPNEPAKLKLAFPPGKYFCEAKIPVKQS